MLMPEISRRFSFLGLGESSSKVEPKRSTTDGARKGEEFAPNLKLQVDKNVYRPGDEVLVTIELQNPRDPIDSNEITSSLERKLLVEQLSFELKGIEKLDTQWFATQKPLGSKQRRGEHVFLDSSTTSLISNQVISSGSTKKYVVRTVLPRSIPPSYRGTTIRYLYYVRSTLSGQWLMLENGRADRELTETVELEARVPMQLWVSQKLGELLSEEGQGDGFASIQPLQADIYWKEMDGDSDWTRANDIDDGAEEGYDSSRDEISSVSSYNPSRASIHKAFGSSSSFQGSLSRSYREPLHAEADELLHNSSGDILSSNTPPADVSPNLQRRYSKSFPKDDDEEKGVSSPRGTMESVSSEGYIRGRSYNIKLDDQILLRFSPKKSDSNYYFSDMIGGTLSFFHEEGTRRCLEVSITLEISETIDRRFVHPSRRNSPTITKVHSDHHEVVADILQTSFLFSIPMDGPMSFSTPHVSVQWALRFEFFTTPRNVDWRRYDHPLLVEGRDKCEWSLPITVHAPQPGAAAAHARSRKNVSFEPLWVRD